LKSKPDWVGAILIGSALAIAITVFFVLGLLRTANATHARALSWSNFYQSLPINITIIGGFLVAVYLASRKR
jgi:hypothetical protein